MAPTDTKDTHERRYDRDHHQGRHPPRRSPAPGASTHQILILPGGHVEPGEGVETALIREVAEEFSISATIIRFRRRCRRRRHPPRDQPRTPHDQLDGPTSQRHSRALRRSPPPAAMPARTARTTPLELEPPVATAFSTNEESPPSVPGPERGRAPCLRNGAERVNPAGKQKPLRHGCRSAVPE